MSKQESIQSERPTDTDGINIGGRPELFVDHYLIDQMYGTQLKLHAPVKKEIAIAFDQPWEGPGSSAYNSVFFDGEKYRLYYRACAQKTAKEKGDLSTAQYTCLALSDDGIHWEKPELGLVEFEGSTKNNILLSGIMSHNFSPFLDTNPACAPEARYKAVAGHISTGLVAYQSADGIHWSKMQEEPIIRDGALDSQNLCFYDPNIDGYQCYSRCFARRSIGNPSRRMVNSREVSVPDTLDVSVSGSAQSRIPAPRIFCTGSRCVQTATSTIFRWNTSTRTQPSFAPCGTALHFHAHAVYV